MIDRDADSDGLVLNSQKASLARVAGDLFLTALFEPGTLEVALNSDGVLWHERLGEPMRPIGRMNRYTAMQIITDIAGILDKVVTADNATLEAELPLDGSRVEAMIPPVVSAPVFSIRKRASKVIPLDEYVAAGIMTARQCEIVRQGIRDKKNLVILGGTGSGKTTLGNAVLHEISLIEPDARLVIIEDTGELQCTARNKVFLHTTLHNTMMDLIKATLRLRPDRVVVGEVRGAEAFELLQIWNTGHPGGLVTVHANDCQSALSRLKGLVSQHPYAPRDIEPDIALAVNYLVSIVKTPESRRVNEIMEVIGYGKDGYETRRIL
jgi:type IV secretion system protein VirB11